jgi:rhamnogalacturonan endolyase
MRLLSVLLVMCLFASLAPAQRWMEKLDRGVVAIRTADGNVFVSWRLLASDPDAVAFNVYRDGTRLNPEPLTAGTNLVDDSADPAKPASYTVRAVVNGAEQPAAASGTATAASVADATPWTHHIPVEAPEGYRPGDASVGDLDGDGQYEIVVLLSRNGRDNSQGGVTDPVLIQALKLDGSRLWTIDLGKNIRSGAHYTQLMVYDLDLDGIAEIVVKTADGTVDGTGQVIGDANADHRGEDGRINRGPEFLTVFNGRTGAIIDTVPYVPLRGIDKHDITGDEMNAIWGDGYGNRVDRFLAAVAYLDGERPSVVMCRGYYTRSFLVAWDLRDGKLQKRWVFDSNEQGREFAGQGNHNISVADVDDDGRDEIVYGAMVVDDDGTGLFSTRLGHGDAMHVADHDPSNPGLELVRIQEPVSDAGLHMISLKTGEVLWRVPSVIPTTQGGGRGRGQGPGRGAGFDIDPRHPGSESWAFGGGVSGLRDAKGNVISDVTPRSCNMAIWWDGDELRELLDGTNVSKWNYEQSRGEPLFDAAQFDCVKINGTKSNPSLSADLFGDWREELVYPTTDGKALRIFSTTIPTQRRLVTLMHDPVYRLGIAWQNVSYNQPPHVSFFLGAGMEDPKKPNVRMVGE